VALSEAGIGGRVPPPHIAWRPYHAQFMLAQRVSRKHLTKDGLVASHSPLPPFLSLITVVILPGIGIATIMRMVFQVGPFD
jgi:hypothetical protein